MPSVTAIHANAAPYATCATCHADATRYPMNPPIVAPGANHIGMNGQNCDACHVGAGSSIQQLPVRDGARFSGSLFNHGGVTTGCASCHGPGIGGTTFQGITSIVVMPDSSIPGPFSHIPSSTTCEACHVGSLPSGQIAATATRTVPGTGFQLPKPTSAQIHAGVASNCSACHETSQQWVGMDQYPIAGYGGFQTRPQLTAGQFNVADASHPASGDCSQCHIGISFDPANVKLPVPHIPYPTGVQCAACHGNFSQLPTVTATHANISSTSSNCAQCHSTANAAIYNQNITIKIVSPPDTHIAMGALGCESCHVGANSSMTSTPVTNGAKFSNSAFSHSGISTGCETCHGSTVTAGTFFGVSPKTIASLTPAHVPTTAKCETCHVNSIPSMLIPASGATSGMTTFANAQFSHSGITSGCETCHGPNVTGSTFYGINNLIVMPPTSPAGSSSHLPTSTTCENCHAGSVPTTLVPANATLSLGNSGFRTSPPTAGQIHSGVTGGCSSCHDQSAGWIGMDLPQYQRNPAVYVSGAPNTQYTGFQTRPQTTATGYSIANPGHQAGSLATADCSQCHGSFAYFGQPTLPAGHIPYATNAGCTDCHTNWGTSPTIDKIHTYIQSTSSNCAQCHSEANAALYAATTTTRPIVTQNSVANHIPMGGLGCEACHVGANASIVTTPVGATAKFSGAAFSHTGISTGCAACHGSSVTSSTFYGVTPKTISSLSPQHVPNPANLACETCHVNSVPSTPIPASGATGSMTTFANAKFSHSGITSGCAACHGDTINGNSFYGISNIIVIPPSGIPGAGSHLPTTASCETCHAGSVPTTLVAGNATTTAPGTAFQNPVPTAAMIHTGITGGCASCHDTNFVWMGMNKYPITTSAPYTGFQTRPQATAGTFHVADAAHPNGECSNCHTSFANFNGPSAPANHIPYAASAQCSSCHGDFSAVPTVAKIHANIQSTTGNCVQCHSVTNSAIYSANMQQVIKTVPAQHIPMGTAGCETCHVGAGSSIATTPVPDGASFANSLFNHTGATASCATCHGPSVTATSFVGIFPKTIGSLSPAHVPTTAACDVCHVNSVPSGLVPSAGMTTFANGKFSHTGITTGCAACHGSGITGSTFYGISSIVVLPQTSPAGTASHIPAPNSETCEACHSANTPSALVSGNAASTAPGQTGFFSPAPTSAQIHSAVTTCVACHETTMTWMGMSKYPRVPSVKVTGSATPTQYTGFQTRPSTAGAGNSIQDASHDQGDLRTQDCSQCHNGFNYFGTPVAPTNHIPYKAGVSCGACHTSFATAPVAAGNSAMHANFQSSTTNCAQCHSVANAALYAATTTAHPIKTPGGNHIPMGSLGCESCHVAANTATSFTSFANGSFSHYGISTSCGNCHGINVKSDTFEGLPAIVATGTLTPAHIPVSNNISCEVCHANSIPTQLVPASGYAGTPNFSGAKFTHAGVQTTSTCQDCHGPASSGTAYAGISINAIARMPVMTPGSASSHLPTSLVCANCHQASTPAGLINGVYNGTTPTGFRLPAPSAAMIHAGVTGGCSTCHDQSVGWVGMDLYPRSPSSYTGLSTTQYKGFQTRPKATATGYSVGSPSHQTGNAATGDCSQCHGSFAYFGQPTLPAAHIPYAASASCNSCHTNWGVAPTSAAIHANIQSTTGNCVQCHSTANAAKYASTITTAGGIKTPSTTTPVHIPMRNLGCESCHTAANTMTTWTSFANAQFSHSGMNTNCAECHGNGVGAFEGNPVIVKMPATTPTNTGTAHFPVTTTCESCHLGSMPSGLVAGSATTGTGFRISPPNSATIHTGVSTCNSCHEKDMVWVGMDLYPKTTSPTYRGFHARPYGSPTNPSFTVNDAAHPTGGDCSTCHTGFTEWRAQVVPNNHIPYKATAACDACHKPVAGITNYSNMPALLDIHTNAQSTTSNCAQCHSNAGATKYNSTNLTLTTTTSSHIAMAALGCENCHVGTANTSITSTPVGNGASFSGSAFDHAGSSTVCANCHGNSITTTTFQGGQVPKTMAGLSPVHVPNPAALDCAACHTAVPTGQVRLGTATTTFANGKFSHTNTTSNCALCHGAGVTGSSFFGISRIVALTNYTASSGTNSHIPAPNNGTCEACHLGNTPSTPSPANATTAAVAWNGASGFYTPAPNTTQIHSAIGTITCVTCHEAGLTWSGMAKYPRTPNVLTANATYTGFHGRPVAGGAVNSIADANHPDQTSGDCSKCHGSTTSFSVTSMPTNHIPIGATASCTACHTNITATNKDFSVPPTHANIHLYGPANTATNCGQCHTNANATKYSRTTAPAYTVVGAGSTHVPYGTTNCTVCHTAAATLNYTSFANGRFSHAGITTGCASCHGGTVTGFQGIPLTKLVVATSTTTPGPNNHIPFTAACEVCHAGSVPAIMDIPATKPAYGATGFRNSPPTSAMTHTGITKNCQVCHEQGYQWAGMNLYPINPSTITANGLYKGFQMRPFAGGTLANYSVADAGHEAPGLGVGTDCAQCHVGTIAFTGAGKPDGHIPTNVSCTTCHIVSGNYSTTGLSTIAILHTGITPTLQAPPSKPSTSCISCHSSTSPSSLVFAGCIPPAACTTPAGLVYYPKGVGGNPVNSATGTVKHVPIASLDCVACHGSVTSFAGINMGSVGHTNAENTGKIDCQSCHLDESATMKNSTGGLTTNYSATSFKGTPTRRKAGDHNGVPARLYPNDCNNSGCHSYSKGFRSARRPVMREAVVSPNMGRVRPNLQNGKISRGTLGNTYDHVGVKPGQCKTCHDGKSASGMPARHLMVSTSCDTCHRTTSWLPAQFNHNGVTPNTCHICHNGMSASAKPNGHFMTARSCDSCHKDMGWKPVNYQHLSPNYKPSPDALTCVSCHVTNGELIPRQMRGMTRPKPLPVGP